MPKKFFRRIVPQQEDLFKNRFLKRIAPFVKQHNLCVNRRSVAGGVAAGAVGGMIPGPFQVITAAILAIAFRVNLPIAVATTFYTNPFTIGPLYWVAVQIGEAVTGMAGKGSIPPMPSLNDMSFMDWIYALCVWLTSLGVPLLVGLPILTAIIAVAGYFGVSLFWRLRTYYALRKRANQRSRKQDTGDRG